MTTTATAPKPVRGHAGFTTDSYVQAVGFSARPRTITRLYCNGVEVDRGSRSDLLAVLGHAPTKARFVAAAATATR